MTSLNLLGQSFFARFDCAVLKFALGTKHHWNEKELLISECKKKKKKPEWYFPIIVIYVRNFFIRFEFQLNNTEGLHRQKMRRGRTGSRWSEDLLRLVIFDALCKWVLITLQLPGNVLFVPVAKQNRERNSYSVIYAWRRIKIISKDQVSNIMSNFFRIQLSRLRNPWFINLVFTSRSLP